MKAVNHRAFNIEGANHQNFLQKTIKQLSELNTTIDFSEEIRELTEKLN